MDINKSQIDRITRLSEKYRIDSPLDHHQLELSGDSIRQAYRQSQQMAIKLKQIRSTLGYQNDTASGRPTPQQPPLPLPKAKKEDRGLNLKKFVLSMRKRTESGGIVAHSKNSLQAE